MGFEEQRDKGIYIRVTREQVLDVDGNRGTNTIKNIFRIWGTREQANHFKGTREQLSSGTA